MTLEKYIAMLQAIANKHPNIQVVYTIDDEGNGFNTVHHGPTIGKYEDGGFDPNIESPEEANAVCLN